MRIRITCPACGKSRNVPHVEAGQIYLCPACGTRFGIPSAQGLPSNVPPAAEIGVAPRPSEPPLQEPPMPAPPMPQISEPPEPPGELSPTPVAPSANWIYPTAAGGVMALLLIAFLVIWISRPATSSAPSAVATPATVPTRIATTTVSTQPWFSLGKPMPTAPPRVIPPPQPIALAPAPKPPTTQETTTQPAEIQPIPAMVDVTDPLDGQIGQSIHRGVTYLLNQFKNGGLHGYNGGKDQDVAAMDALCVYALLHAGEATNDSRIGPHSDNVDQMLKILKRAPMEIGPATYSRSLRASALAVYDRAEDDAAMRADAAWLIRDAVDGSYSYTMPPPNILPQDFGWDNSNSQYGALGVWAASEAGYDVPGGYWIKVRQHWLDCQLSSGQWAYSNGDSVPRLSMTVAGITTLFIAQDQLLNAAAVKAVPEALARGLNWLETGDNSVTLTGLSVPYNLYGLERAALASGFKYFGTHDWYRELATSALAQQKDDGSWTADFTGDPVISTSFTLLFLSRGRHPIFMNKLRFDGPWDERPRDVSNLCRYATHMLERPVNWQVVSLSSDWTDWMDSPVLFIASSQPPPLEDVDYGKLKAFAENGGLIFTHADGGSEPFNRFVATLCKRIFPNYPLADLPPQHDVYSSLFPITKGPRLQGVSNGSRLLLLHSPTDLNSVWQSRDWSPQPLPFELGLNVFIYAAGRVNMKNKLETPLVLDPQINPIATIPVARLRYNGNWDPEPAAWPRMSRLFLAQTSILADPTFVDLKNLQLETAPLAHLTGTGKVNFSETEVKALRDYIDAGGVLLIDACGGSNAFGPSAIAHLLFPQSPLEDLPADHPILAGTGIGMNPVKLQLRPRLADLVGTTTAPLGYLSHGRGCIICSNYDLTTAMLGTNTYSVNGYEPETVSTLLQNLLLWIVERKKI